MDQFRETRCLFCEESITYRVGELVNLETHLTITHEVTSNQTFALYILFLNNEEIKEMKRRLEPRMRDLRSEIVQNLPSEWRPEISEQKDPDEIQARLMEQMTDSDGEEKDHYDEAYPIENIHPALQGDTLEGGEHCQHKVVEVGDPKIGPLCFFGQKR